MRSYVLTAKISYHCNVEIMMIITFKDLQPPCASHAASVTA